MKKSYILGVFIIGIVLGVSITFLIMTKNDEGSDSNIVEDTRDESTSTEERDLSWIDDVHAEMLDDWESGQKMFDERLIHKMLLDMTHQKGEVHVDGSSMEITSERVDKLMQIVEADKAILMHYQAYVDILKRWEKGDFSVIYDDHDLLHTFYDR
ncbi:DUF6241 domain-containing protein [Solibacillus cecembensis]|uniref:DUF6241 domain-containing protein n=1 Tax=Solibacillus cecembensis TaxID=459347 RepID=UPI003CFD60BE